MRTHSQFFIFVWLVTAKYCCFLQSFSTTLFMSFSHSCCSHAFDPLLFFLCFMLAVPMLLYGWWCAFCIKSSTLRLLQTLRALEQCKSSEIAPCCCTLSAGTTWPQPNGVALLGPLCIILTFRAQRTLILHTNVKQITEIKCYHDRTFHVFLHADI